MARNKGFNLTDDIRLRSIKPRETPAGMGAEGTPPEYVELKADAIRPSPFNEGLSHGNIEQYVDSMKENGLIEPIVVYDIGDGKYEILSGHQRYEAWCNRLGHKTIKAVVRPYEKDPVLRFKAHTQANVVTREKDVAFWLSRMNHARQLIRQDPDFGGTREEEVARLGEMLNMSPAHVYRYENYEKLVPELQVFETKGLLTISTLYGAAGLDEEQMRVVAEKVWAFVEAKKKVNPLLEDGLRVTREEFDRIVKAVKKGNSTDPVPHKKKTYAERLDRAADGILNIIAKTKNNEERKEALEQIEKLQLKLEEIKTSLTQG